MAEEKLDTRVRRQQIAEAALSLVAEHGLRRLSIAAVARRVGLVPSGIYRHFKSKDGLLDAVLERVQERLVANVEAACQASDDPFTRLKDVLMRHIRFIREGRAIPRIIFSDDVHAGNPQRRQKVLGIFTVYVGRVAEIVREGQSHGRIRHDVDAETIAMMLFGIIVPAGILWHLTEGGFDVTRHAQHAWQLFASSIAISASPLASPMM
jgi:AcrR family transcriptional regulator